MTVARGTVYGLREAWERAMNYFENFGNDWLVALFVMALAYGIAFSIKKNGMKGLGTAAVPLLLVAIVASMMLPALSKAKAKAGRIKSVNNLKQIGLALWIAIAVFAQRRTA